MLFEYINVDSEIMQKYVYITEYLFDINYIINEYKDHVKSLNAHADDFVNDIHKHANDITTKRVHKRTSKTMPELTNSVYIIYNFEIKYANIKYKQQIREYNNAVNEFCETYNNYKQQILSSKPKEVNALLKELQTQLNIRYNKCVNNDNINVVIQKYF